MVSFYIQPTGARLCALAMALLVLAGCASHREVSPDDRGASAGAVQTDPSPLREVFRRYEGTPYRYGGTNARGFDCSGFIQTAYREAYGVLLPRTTADLRASGYGVSRDRIQPGDLVFFRIRGKEQHAGIYMGQNRFIHASTSVGVTESSLTDHYWRQRFSRARRLE